MQEKSEYQKVRESILDQKEPFCLIDLYNRLEKAKVTTDRELVLDVLDELYDDGLVEHKNLDPDKGIDSTRYGFVVI